MGLDFVPGMPGTHGSFICFLITVIIAGVKLKMALPVCFLWHKGMKRRPLNELPGFIKWLRGAVLVEHCSQATGSGADEYASAIRQAGRHKCSVIIVFADTTWIFFGQLQMF